MSCVDVLERVRDSPERARSFWTVRAAISFARLVDRPCCRSLRLTCSYWRARLVPFLTPLGGIGSPPRVAFRDSHCREQPPMTQETSPHAGVRSSFVATELSTGTSLQATDPEIARLVEEEERRQRETIRLIPSENYASKAVIEATGTVLTNKYSEGYPGRRYYEGQQVIDPIETLAIERAERLFGVDHANVQPYSGSVANLAVYLAFCEPGDTVMGMALPMGGHLTHGWSVSITGKWLRAPRGAMLMCREEHAAALDKAVFPGLQGGPHDHITAAIAVALEEASRPQFAEYAHRIVDNARTLADELIRRGFDLISGGTDTHLILIDLTSKEVAGKVASQALDRAGLETNYNTVPFDPRKPFDPSGLRIGTPSVTTRGMGRDEMLTIADLMDRVIEAARAGDDAALDRIRDESRELATAFPAPGIDT